MNILKHAQESGENVVMVGATGPGTETSIDSLTELMELYKHGHPGGRISFAASDIEQLREIPADANVVLSNCNVKILTCPDS